MEIRGMDFIGEYQISPDTCDSLVEHFEKEDTFKIDGLKAQDSIHSYTDSTDAILLGDARDSYLAELGKCMRMYVDTWPNCKNLVNEWGIYEDISIHKYAPGFGNRSPHCERTDAKGKFGKRLMAFETHLTDGGEIEFVHQKRSVKPVKGTTLIWPVDWTHTHKVSANNLDTKYVISGWISFSDRIYVGLSRCKNGD
jgi:hypothetical protein